MSVIFTTTIDIDAPASAVWAVLTDFPNYGAWSNFTSVDGIAKVGTRLAMKMPGFNFGATVMTAQPNERLEWAASLFNRNVFCGRHTFTLSTNPDGTTRVTNIETFSGWLLRPFEGFFNRGKAGNGGGYASFNQALKKRVEGSGTR